jgi:hypothetical protein
MKEFEGVFQEKDKMEVSIQKKQQKEKVAQKEIKKKENEDISTTENIR